MTPQQFETFLERNEQSTAEAIEKTVNGKIRNLTALVEAHNANHDNDMLAVRTHIQAVQPIVIEYQEREAARAYAKKIGDGVKWTAALITAGSVILAAVSVCLKSIWTK